MKVILALVFSGVVLADLFYRIWLAGSFPAFLANSLAPRGAAVWFVIKADWSPGYEFGELLDILTPVATGLLMHIVMRAPLRRALLPLAIMIVGYFLLISNGGRTQLVEAFVIGTIYSFLQPKHNITRLSIATAVMLLVILIVTAYRARGLGSLMLTPNIELQYQQDDNFYEMLRVLAISHAGAKTWDAWTFLITCFVNPIPRAWWPGKPFLDQAFYGNYKEFWITITSWGELIACFGTTIAMIVNTLLILSIYLFLRKKFYDIKSIVDVIVYVTAVLWCYMILRSLLNITQFAYPYVLAECMRKILAYHMHGKTRKRNETVGILPNKAV